MLLRYIFSKLFKQHQLDSHKCVDRPPPDKDSERWKIVLDPPDEYNKENSPGVELDEELNSLLEL